MGKDSAAMQAIASFVVYGPAQAASIVCHLDVHFFGDKVVVLGDSGVEPDALSSVDPEEESSARPRSPTSSINSCGSRLLRRMSCAFTSAGLCYYLLQSWLE